VQYVIGQTDFRDHTFKVDKRALIPRPETEVLVETVLQCAPLWALPAPVLVDVGTGTGCIAVSLGLARPQAWVVGIDVSPEALGLASENAKALGAGEHVTFVDGDLPAAIEPESVDAVVSNPPYIPSADCDRLPVHIRDHEPRLALDGGPDGLNVVRALVEDSAIVLKSGGRIFLEFGYGQGPAVRALLEQAGFAEVALVRDLSGKDRIASARLE
jgi:release factor glutamine methyltransferase